MESTTIAADLAKNVIEIAVRQDGRIVRRERLTREAFTLLLATHPCCRIVMEACGGAHYWGRKALSHGHEVRLLPAQYVKAYRRRNKTDRADCAAILQADLDPEIRSVPVKSVDQQAIQTLHRVRSSWMSTRNARINEVRGALREMGLTISQGAKRGMEEMPLAIDHENVPPALRPVLQELLTEVREYDDKIKALEKQLARMTENDPAVQAVRQVSGIGLLTSTAMVAMAVDPKYFRSGRDLSAWVGVTPREHSSGETRRLGGMSKQGNVYLRTLLIQGGRSVLLRAKALHKDGKELNYLQKWAVQLEARAGFNKATVGVANKIARIAWACWKDGTVFDGNYAAA